MIALFCSLFVFLGIYLCDRFDLKKYSINSIFGLFLVNGFFNVLIGGYGHLFINYHRSTFLFLVLGCILGFSIMKLIGFKYDETDNISILGFSLINSYLLVIGRFSFLFLLINILYYVLIGAYVKGSRSWIYVFLGVILGLFFSLFSGWIMGYMFTIIFGFLLYFILSVYGIVFKSSSRISYYALICGFLVALLGSIL